MWTSWCQWYSLCPLHLAIASEWAAEGGWSYWPLFPPITGGFSFFMQAIRFYWWPGLSVYHLSLFFFLQELAVAHCLSTEMINSGSLQSQQLQTMSFLAIDIYAKLVFSILKVVHCISFSFLVCFWVFLSSKQFCWLLEQGSNKPFLLSKVCNKLKF